MSIHIREPYCPKSSRYAENLTRYLNRRGIRAQQIRCHIDNHHYFSNCVQIIIPVHEKKIIVRVLERNKVAIPFTAMNKNRKNAAPLIFSREELISHLRTMIRDKPVHQ